jgi:hypothetical protein
MRPCELCDSGYAIGVWMSALLILTLVIAWKHWPRMGRAGRMGIAAACVAALGGSIGASYWQGRTGSKGGACGTCVMPVLPGQASRPATRPAGVATTVASRPVGDSSPVTMSAEVVAFYFHRTVRCQSCLQIEDWARQAIEQQFTGELTGGLIEWHPVNIEEPGNEHFEKDYELTSQSLVLVRMKDGQPVEWKNLKSVWELLGDYARFAEYVQTETTSFLRGASGM